jgi:hypothetical protein
MNGIALRILKEVETRGEVSLLRAIELGGSLNKDHRDQYPLALLCEEGYLGMTINHIPPTGAEEMREFSLATTLHMFSLPRNPQGETHYLEIRSTGNLDPAKERVFMKAKGALYLDEMRRKNRDRFWAFILGLSAGVLGSWAKDLLKML